RQPPGGRLAVPFELVREGGDEGGGERSLGEEIAEQVRDAERGDEGVQLLAGPEGHGEDLLPHHPEGAARDHGGPRPPPAAPRPPASAVIAGRSICERPRRRKADARRRRREQSPDAAAKRVKLEKPDAAQCASGSDAITRLKGAVAPGLGVLPSANAPRSATM